MNQPRFDFSAETGHRAYARSSDPDTSHAAASRVAPSALERRVVEALLATPPGSGGLTAPEIAVLLGERDGSISPRMPRLVELGRVRLTGEQRNRARVWEACRRAEG